MAKKSTHVVPNKARGGWDIKQSGAKRSSVHISTTKKDAVNRARVISRNQRTELFIHNRDGRISRKDSHGNDPYPPKG